jgi:hypothetical protein
MYGDIPTQYCVTFFNVGDFSFLLYKEAPYLPDIALSPDDIQTILGSSDALKLLTAARRTLRTQRQTLISTFVDYMVDYAKRDEGFGVSLPLLAVDSQDQMTGQLPAINYMFSAARDVGAPYSQWDRKLDAGKPTWEWIEGGEVGNKNAYDFAMLKRELKIFVSEYLLSQPDIPKYLSDWAPTNEMMRNFVESSAGDAARTTTMNCVWLYQQRLLQINNTITSIGADIENQMYLNHEQRLNEIAQSKGFADWPSMAASRDVEIEWYCAIYDMPGCGPGEGLPKRALIEAYKRLETESFGETSYQMSLKGEQPQFVRMTDNPEVLGLLERMIDEKEAQIKEQLDSAEAELEKKKEQDQKTEDQLPVKILIGGLIVLGALKFLDSKRG